MAIPTPRYLHCEQCGWRNKTHMMGDVLYPPGTCPKCGHALKWEMDSGHCSLLGNFCPPGTDSTIIKLLRKLSGN